MEDVWHEITYDTNTKKNRIHVFWVGKVSRYEPHIHLNGNFDCKSKTRTTREREWTQNSRFFDTVDLDIKMYDFWSLNFIFEVILWLNLQKYSGKWDQKLKCFDVKKRGIKIKDFAFSFEKYKLLFDVDVLWLGGQENVDTTKFCLPWMTKFQRFSYSKRLIGRDKIGGMWGKGMNPSPFKICQNWMTF